MPTRPKTNLSGIIRGYRVYKYPGWIFEAEIYTEYVHKVETSVLHTGLRLCLLRAYAAEMRGRSSNAHTWLLLAKIIYGELQVRVKKIQIAKEPTP